MDNSNTSMDEDSMPATKLGSDDEEEKEVVEEEKEEEEGSGNESDGSSALKNLDLSINPNLPIEVSLYRSKLVN